MPRKINTKKNSSPKTAAQKKISAPKSVFQTFRQLYISEIPDDDLSQVNIKSLDHLIRRHFEMAEQKGKSRYVIQIGNPDTKSWGFENQNTVLCIYFEDMAFVIDSVTALLTERSFGIENTFHPLLFVKRDRNGKLEETIVNRKEGYSGEGYLYIELSRRLTPAQIKTLQTDIANVFEDVRFATKDWRTIKAKVLDAKIALKNAPDVEYDDMQEYLEFLNYLYDDNFTLLGYKKYDVVARGGKSNFAPDAQSGLGLLSATRKNSFLNGEEKSFFENSKVKADLPIVFISKLALKSPVHRRVPIDAVLIRQFNEKGKFIAEILLLGLFTSVTYSRSTRGVPFLRNKAEKIQKLADFDENSHDLRALRHIIEKFPRDEFMQTDVETLHETCMRILKLQERPRTALFLREDPFGRTISALIYIPRDRFDTRLRLKFQKILETELHATCSNYTSTVDDSSLVRILFSLELPHGTRQEYDPSFIEARIQEAGRGWDELLFHALMAKYKDHDNAAALSHKYNSAFPVAYQERYKARQALHDISKIETVIESNKVELELFKPNGIQDRHLSLKIFSPSSTLSLSDILPVLENFGLRVIEEYPFEITIEGRSIWIQELVLEIPAALEKVDVASIKTIFETSLKQISSGDIEDDSLNKLVVLSGLESRQIAVLRTYVRYLRQSSLPFSLQYIEQALTDYPVIAKLLVNLFFAHFDPDNQKKGAALVPALLASIEQNLQSVKALDQDRILRSMIGLVEASLRTNFFQNKPWISIKFDSSRVPELPAPRPYREIFVYSPRVEGVHLRGHVIARGGLRWSDRNEDFRTEVLGLMKAQQVKNAIIVPMGAKGGFIVKKPPIPFNRDAFMTEGKDCYRTFIRGLLDITDNQKGGKIVPPEKVVRLDSDDSYLVVAADKGTATFSDIANALSEEYNFWLGDAFASGGSHGYDHKVMGITARGAWESVKRHFHELGIDVQSQPFDVIGVGDMGGDVFGNGLLQSKTARLIGAFNHVHIFCDPNPNAAETYKERARLFKEVKGWDFYDQKKLSKGGKIFSRADKSLKLTPEIQKCFGISKSEVTPNELMQAMLKAKTDLLFFGGIGTFVKSEKEAHLDAGDRSNDATRINGAELRARVVGEGANLGMTQLGRIEYAQQGGRLNTDFIDNSAGVDTSDHEVNIKILLASVMAQKGSAMNLKSRDKLLESMTLEVEKLVLRDNYQQAQALSLVTSQSKDLLNDHAELMALLEKDGLLNRKIEFLPDAETIEKRRVAGLGMTRPELCVLFSYSKISFTRALLETKLPDDKSMTNWAVSYFPQALQKKYEKEILNHKLRRNIIAMMISNSIINRMGPSFIRLTAQRTGRKVEDIALAYLKARDTFNARELWDSIENLGAKVRSEVQLEAMKTISSSLEKIVYQYLKSGKLPAKVHKLAEAQDRNLWVKAGLPDAIAKKIAELKTASAANI